MRLPGLGRRVEYLPQMEVTECGAACLAMVLAFHGRHESLPEVRQACGVSRDGASALAILGAAWGYGLDAEGVRADLADLKWLPCPAILHWGFDHFVVLERVCGGGAVLVDPASGRRRVARPELDRYFTGAALVFEPGAAFQRKARTRPSLAKYREVIRASLPGVAQILLATLGLQVVSLALPVASQLLLDRVILPRRESWLWGVAAVLVATSFMVALFGLVQGRVAQALRARLDDALVTKFLDHLLHLPWSFFLQREAGDLLQRVQSNTVLRDFLGGQAAHAVLDGALLLSFGALMLFYHPALGLLVVAFGLAQSALLLSLRDRNRQFLASELAAAGREAGARLEALTNFETIKASGAEARMVQRWAHRSVARVDSSLARHRLGLAFGAVLTFFQSGTSALVFLYGGREVLAHRMTLGVFVAFLSLQGLFLAPLSALLGALDQLLYLGLHLRRLDDVLETAVEPCGVADPGRLGGEIELKGVHFRHAPGAPEVLSGIDLRIRPGEKLALVGPTGAGKSTLARLLIGLHQPTCGSLAFDGRDLRNLDLTRLRRQVGMVLQETFLFDATVRANLDQGDEGLPLERLQWAAQMACLDEVIAGLPGGYACRLGENGTSLSGGQRQRLSLARALAPDPAILLLDEATSSLDLATEARIHDHLKALGCTRILIAHRLATVRDADRILVLEGGRIIQSGTFSELRAVEGPFRTMAAGLDQGHA